MAQWDLILTQNVVVGVNYEEKFVNIAKGGLLSADVSQTPTVLAGGTDGYVLGRDDAEATGLKWVPAATDNILAWDNTNKYYSPFAAQSVGGTFDSSSTTPTLTTRLNYNGAFWATQIQAYGGTSFAIYANTAATANYAFQSYASAGGGILQGDMAGAGSASNLIQVRRLSNTGNATGDLIKVVDTPSTGGTISGSIFKAEVATVDLIDMNPRVVNGASAVAYIFDTHDTLSIAGAKLLSLRNNQTEEFSVSYNGVVNVPTGGDYQINGVSIVSSTSFGTVGQIPVMNAGGTDFDYSAELTFVSGTRLITGTGIDISSGQNFVTINGGYDAGDWTTSNYMRVAKTYIEMVATSQRFIVNPTVADGAAAVAFYLTTTNALTIAGAKLMGLRNNGVEKFFVDKDGNVDIEAGAEYRINGVSVGGLWSRAATTISPLTATDHVQLGASANLQLGGATNTYINGGPAGGNINITVSGNAKMNFTPSVTVCYQSFSTNLTDTIDIGTSTSWFKDIYAQRYYLDEIGTYIYSNLGVLTFVDGTTGSKTLAELATVGSGTVTAVNNGNGMNFTNITTTGTVTLGTPSTLTSATTNAVTTSSHTHNITTGIANTNIVAVNGTAVDNDYAKFTASGLEGRTYAELAQDIDSSVFNFSATNLVTGGRFEFQDSIPCSFGDSSDFDIYFKETATVGLYVDGISTANDIFFSVAEAVKFTFDMGASTGTAIDWVATSDIRVKTHVRPFTLDMEKFLVLGSKAIRHNWKEGFGPANTPEIGFIAQDLEKFFPELVHIGSARPHLRGISYGKLVTVAIKATAQTWQYAAKIDTALGVVRSELEDLKIEVEELKQQLNTIQNG